MIFGDVLTFFRTMNALRSLSLIRIIQATLAGLMGLTFSHSLWAATPINLSHSFAGNVSFELAAGSFLNDPNNLCSYGSSASGTLSGNIPADAQIKGAYLYWAASTRGSFVDNTVIFNGQSIVADQTYTVSYSPFFGVASSLFFSGKKDVTSLIGKTGADLASSFVMEGLTINNSSRGGFFEAAHCKGNDNDTVLGGWSLVVAYEHESLPFQVTNVFDGFEDVYNLWGSSAIRLTLDNFKVANNPSGKHAHITWEGDASKTDNNESLIFNTTELTDTVNPPDNQFNSISNIYSGASAQTLGIDVDAYDISAYLTPGMTSATTDYGTGSDMVLLSAEVISVSNVPVADIAINTTAPQAWQKGAQISKKFTISNNGPNDIPKQRAKFTTTLPANLSFVGTQQGLNSDWLCTQNGRSLECIYQPVLRSGWSVYLDLNLLLDANSGNTVALTAKASHDNGTQDIFDNVTSNNSITLNVNAVNTPVTDLSASTKVPVNLSGDSLLAGNTLEYTITIDDAADLAVNNLSVVDNLPLNISDYRITSPLPVGAVDNSTYISKGAASNQLNISGLNLAAGNGPDSTITITLEVDIDATAPVGASLRNTATLSYNSQSWLVDTGDLTLVAHDFSATTKQASDINGNLLLAGDTIRYVIDVKDKGGLSVTGLQVVDHLPAYIDSYTISGIPSGASNNSTTAGGNNGTGKIDISDISLNTNESLQLIIEAVVNASAPAGTSLLNTANVILNNKQWDIASNEMLVNSNNQPSTSGNKPLYIHNGALTRELASSNQATTLVRNGNTNFTLTPALQSDLTLNTNTIPLNLALTGDGGLNITVELSYNNGSTQVIATGNFVGNSGNTTVNLTIPTNVTIPKGTPLQLTFSNTNRNVAVNSFTGSFRSALVLDAATVINVDDISVWDKPYGDASATTIAESKVGDTFYIRTTISDPFGAFDITKAELTLTKADGSIYDLSALPNNNIMSCVENCSSPADQTTHTKVYEMAIPVSATETSDGFWNITIKAFEGQESGTKQVTHERSNTYLIKRSTPIVSVQKTVTIVSDPLNGTNKPKAIPGAQLIYDLLIRNSGDGKTDNNSIIIQSTIPNNASLFIGNLDCMGLNRGTQNQAICFKDGSGAQNSGLNFTMNAINDVNDHVSFSINGTDFSYQPNLANGNYDAAIRFIRFEPKGELNGVAIPGQIPQLTFSYQLKLD